MIVKGKDLEKLDGVKGDYIEGVEINKLRTIPDERGMIYHMLRNDDKIFEKLWRNLFF